MANLNRVFLIGRLTRDPELRYTPSGMAVTDLSIATTRTYTTKAGERKEEVTYIDIVAWSRQAETCGEYLVKGSPVFVEGRLQLDSWETPEGERRRKLRVIAERIQFLGKIRTSTAPGPSDTAEEKKSDQAVTPEKNEDKFGDLSKNISDSSVGEDDIPF